MISDKAISLLADIRFLFSGNNTWFRCSANFCSVCLVQHLFYGTYLINNMSSDWTHQIQIELAPTMAIVPSKANFSKREEIVGKCFWNCWVSWNPKSKTFNVKNAKLILRKFLELPISCMHSVHYLHCLQGQVHRLHSRLKNPQSIINLLYNQEVWVL